MTRWANSFDALADETALTVGNSGGANGDAVTLVNQSAGDFIGADTAKASHGAVSLRVQKGATAGRIGLEHSVSGWGAELYFRQRIWLDAWPTTGEVRFLTVVDAAGANMAGVAINSTGLIALYDAAGFISSSTGSTVPAGQWVRVDVHITVSATVGMVEALVYADPAATTPTFTKASTATRNTGTTADRRRAGRDSGPSNSPAFWLDNLVASNVSYADLDDPPPPPAPTTTGWRVGTLPFGSTVGGWTVGVGAPLPASGVIEEPPPPPPPIVGTNLAYAEGVWLIQQIGSFSALQAGAAKYRSYINRPGIAGLSLRIPSTLLYTASQVWDPTIPEWAFENITQPVGKKFDIRPMAGRYTPVWAMGRYYELLQQGGPWRIPVPFQDSGDGNPLTPGVPGNPTFEAWFRDVALNAAAWSRDHAIRCLHLPWYGRLWSEYNNGDIQDLPGYGTTNANFIEPHKRLVDYGLDVAGPDLMVEWPTSGHPNNGPGTPAANIHEAFNYGAARVGDYSDLGPMNTANGWGGVGITQPIGSVPGGSGSDTRGSARTPFGYQAWADRLQTQRYSWTSTSTTTVPIGMFALAKKYRARRCEVYDGSFEEAEAVNLYAGALDYQGWLEANPTLVAPA